MENQYNYYHRENEQGIYQNPGQPEYPQREQKEKKPRKTLPKVVGIIGLALLFGIVSSATFLTSNIIGSKILGLNTTSGSRGTDAKQSTPVNNSSKDSASAVTTDVSQIVENVMPSVVSITNMSVQQVQSFFGGVYQQEIQSAGTGIIISQTDEELLIVTNNHVIADSETLTVTFADESSVEANVKGADSVYDIAVIAVGKDQISADTMNAIAVATLGDSNMLKVGEPAIAIGNALGYGQSVTTGVISAVNRQIASADQQTGQMQAASEEGVNLIQTDAAINPGNSGGALVNLNGEVVGINSSKLAQTTIEGMGYAIPISDVSDIIDNLMNQKTKRKVAEGKQGYIGIKGYDVTTESAAMYQMPEGVYIYEVTKGGGAEKAGITQGNIITAVNGSTVKNMEALKKELTYYAAGETVTLTIHIPENNGEYTEKNVEVVLGKAS